MPRLPESWDAIAKILNYETEEEMLKDLYLVQDLSIQAMVKKLGFAQNVIRTRLLGVGVKLRPRGGANSTGHTKFRDVSDEDLMKLKAGDKIILGDNQVTVLYNTLYKEKVRRGLITPCTSAPSPQLLISTGTPEEATPNSPSPNGACETHDTSSGISEDENKETLLSSITEPTKESY